MARTDLSTLLGTLGDDTAARDQVVPGATKDTLSKKAPDAREETNPQEAPRRTRKKGPEAAPSPAATPTYLSLERKEARLRRDQYEALTSHARRLNRQKAQAGERITENTLIRVAIDLLLTQNIDSLAGANELELRKSVGL